MPLPVVEVADLTEQGLRFTELGLCDIPVLYIGRPMDLRRLLLG